MSNHKLIVRHHHDHRMINVILPNVVFNGRQFTVWLQFDHESFATFTQAEIPRFDVTMPLRRVFGGRFQMSVTPL